MVPSVLGGGWGPLRACEVGKHWERISFVRGLTLAVGLCMVTYMNSHPTTSPTEAAKAAAIQAIKVSRAAGRFGNAEVFGATLASLSGYGFDIDEAKALANYAIHAVRA